MTTNIQTHKEGGDKREERGREGGTEEKRDGGIYTYIGGKGGREGEREGVEVRGREGGREGGRTINCRQVMSPYMYIPQTKTV